MAWQCEADYSLDEFTFCFNGRGSRSRGKLFYRFVQPPVEIEPTPYKNLIKHVKTGPGHKRQRSLESTEYALDENNQPGGKC